MTRSPLTLAALASVAVPGLEPAGVEGLPGATGDRYDIAFVQDAQHRRWVVRAPRTEAASAAVDQVQPLLAALARRMPFAVPAAKGSVVSKRSGSAVVYPYIPGHPIDLAAVPPGAGVAAELGRALAALHNTSTEIFDDAGVPSYDAEAYRHRRLTEVDRAAATGRVPAALLQRWERALEDVSLWRFAPVPTHGGLSGEQVLVAFEDEQDATTARVRGLLGWEQAQVADPADDFAQIVQQASPETQDTVFEAYAHARVERPDRHLRTRARLSAELALSRALMRAIHDEEPAQVEHLSAELRRLDERVHAETEAADDYRLSSLPPVAPRRSVAPPPQLDLEQEDTDALVIFGGREAEPEDAPRPEAPGDALEGDVPAADVPAAEPDESGDSNPPGEPGASPTTGQVSEVPAAELTDGHLGDDLPEGATAVEPDAPRPGGATRA